MIGNKKLTLSEQDFVPYYLDSLVWSRFGADHLNSLIVKNDFIPSLQLVANQPLEILCKVRYAFLFSLKKDENKISMKLKRVQRYKL